MKSTSGSTRQYQSKPSSSGWSKKKPEKYLRSEGRRGGTDAIVESLSLHEVLVLGRRCRLKVAMHMPCCWACALLCTPDRLGATPFPATTTERPQQLACT